MVGRAGHAYPVRLLDKRASNRRFCGLNNSFGLNAADSHATESGPCRYPTQTMQEMGALISAEKSLI
jgi:hypothetical protein